MKKLTRVQKKRKRKKIFLSLVSILFVMGIIIMIMFKAGFFSINNIQVFGNEKTLKNKIILLSSIQEGENIFKISTRDAEKNISTLPYVKNAEVERKIPKTINIKVEERKPKIQFKNVSSFAILDKDGYILENADKRNEQLAEITGWSIENRIPGESIFADNQDDEKLNFIREIVNLNIIDKLKYINMEDDDNINMVIFDEIEVVFGPINNIEYKLDLLTEVMKDIDRKKLKVKMILMNKGENPIVVLEEEEEVEEG